MQTAARLDFIGLPRLRGCGGSVFLCWKENLGAAVDCVGEVGVGARLDCGGEVGFVSVRFGLARDMDCVDEGWIGARLWIVSARLGLGQGCG